jgi:hypothetical protein
LRKAERLRAHAYLLWERLPGDRVFRARSGLAGLKELRAILRKIRANVIACKVSNRAFTSGKYAR